MVRRGPRGPGGAGRRPRRPPGAAAGGGQPGRRGDAPGDARRRRGGHRARPGVEQAPATQGGLMDIRFLGHACFELTEGDARVLVDPFLTGNPKAAVGPDDVDPTHILLTHGHPDHIGDTVPIAKRTGAPVVAIVELAQEIGDEGVQTFDPNLGGTVEFDWGWVRLVPAWHTSTTPKGTVNTTAGLVVIFSGKTIYHLGDTALFSDLSLVPRHDEINVGLICIGRHYTMDRHDAAIA